MKRPLSILLLGRTGFIGKNLLEHLSSFGAFFIDAPYHDELDVIDERSVCAKLASKDYDVVLNCLDLRSMTPKYLEDRLRMYMNLANHADKYGKMIYFGTGAEYGRQIPVNQVSERDFSRVVPGDTYGLLMYTQALNALMSKNIYNLRLFGIFGKYEKWQQRFISSAICKVICGYPITIRQDRVMDYLHIDDLEKIVDWAIGRDPSHHAYNAVSGKRYSLVKLAETIIDHSGKQLPIYVAKEGLQPEYSARNDLLSSEMGGFSPEDMGISIAKMFDYYERHSNEIDKEKLLYS